MSTSRQRHRDKPDAGQGVTGAGSSERTFVIARNRQPDTKLPYLLRLPLEGRLGLKVRDTWPRSSRVYCHAFEEDWPKEADVLEEVPVLSCCRRGAAIDLVLDRPRLARSQFVFTEVRGRPAIFWQTQKTARGANPEAGSPVGERLGERSPLPWTPGSATRSASPPKAQRPCERPCPPATTPCGRRTGYPSPWSSERAWRTSPPRSRTERSPSRCSGSRSFRWQLSSWRAGTPACTRWSTSPGPGSQTICPASRSATRRSAWCSRTPDALQRTGRTGSCLRHSLTPKDYSEQ